MQTFCTQNCARVCVTRSGNHDSPRTGPSAGGVVEFSDALIQLLLLLLQLGLVHSISSLRQLNDTNRAAGDPAGTDPSDGHLLSSFFSSNHPFNGPGHCCRHRSNRHLRTLDAWQVPILHLMHELLQLVRSSLQVKLLKRVMFIFNIASEGK